MAQSMSQVFVNGAVFTVMLPKVVQAAAAWPTLFLSGEHSCEGGLQPTGPHGEHGAPLWDKTIKMVRRSIVTCTPIKASMDICMGP